MSFLSACRHRQLLRKSRYNQSALVTRLFQQSHLPLSILSTSVTSPRNISFTRATKWLWSEVPTTTALSVAPADGSPLSPVEGMGKHRPHHHLVTAISPTAFPGMITSAPQMVWGCLLFKLWEEGNFSVVRVHALWSIRVFSQFQYLKKGYFGIYGYSLPLKPPLWPFSQYWLPLLQKN